jgi:AbrB family looped-hinge helix DNA binding protein
LIICKTDILFAVHLLFMTCNLQSRLVKSPLEVIMQTSVTKRGQTVIPASIRKRYDIQAGDQLVWLDDGQKITVIPVPVDPVRALRGRGRGERLVERLLESRKEDRRRE